MTYKYEKEEVLQGEFMEEYQWTDMMEIMQEIRLFSSLHIRRSKREGITTAQEMDLLSRVTFAKNPLTPHDLTVQMGLRKSAVSRLIEHLEKKGFLEKKQSESDKRSYVLMITQKGTQELDQTYRYYLEPVYHLKKVMGFEEFERLTSQIKLANELLRTEKAKECQEE